MERRLFTYTFLEEYKRHIWPAIGEIDVFLRAAEYPLCAADVACVLDVDEREVLSILAEIGRNDIDKDTFLAIMARGSSSICQMYGREVEIGSPHIYSPSQIAYVYNLDIGAVENACKKIQIKEVTALTMPLVFAQIPFTGPSE